MKENHVMFKQSVFFDDNNELNDTGILLYVDALRLNRESELPEELVEHVTNSANDQKKVFEYYEFVKDDDIQELIPHPYFDKSVKAKTPVISLSRMQGLSIAAAVVMLLGGGYLVSKSLNKNNNPHPTSLIDTITNKPTPSINPDDNKQPETPIAKSENSDSNQPKEINSNQKDAKKVISPQPKVENKRPTPPKNDLLSNENLLAMHGMPHYDRQIDRAGISRGNLKVLAPKIDAEVKQTITFAWNTPVEDSLKLEVFTKETDETGRKIFMIAPKDSTFTLPVKLNAKLYYWELKQVIDDGKEKRVGLGRFFIKK